MEYELIERPRRADHGDERRLAREPGTFSGLPETAEDEAFAASDQALHIPEEEQP